VRWAGVLPPTPVFEVEAWQLKLPADHPLSDSRVRGGSATPGVVRVCGNNTYAAWQHSYERAPHHRSGALHTWMWEHRLSWSVLL